MLNIIVSNIALRDGATFPRGRGQKGFSSWYAKGDGTKIPTLEAESC